MQNLQTLIDQLSKGRKLHICILDLCGILNTQYTQISFKNTLHSKRFCDIAKSSERGRVTCMRCKRLANKKAIKQKKPFCGQCLYGLYEVSFPVIVNNDVAAIIYVGNAVIDQNQAVDRIKKTCAYTGIKEKELYRQLEKCEVINDTNELYQIAELVSDYLKMLWSNAQKDKASTHWLVALMKRHADEMYCTDLSLKELAVTYQKNEKYMGRLFKKEIGVSFHEYYMGLRLQKAEARISQTNDKIIDIALDCGFNNISYFNRVFQRKHGMSPGEFRLKERP